MLQAVGLISTTHGVKGAQLRLLGLILWVYIFLLFSVIKWEAIKNIFTLEYPDVSSKSSYQWVWTKLSDSLNNASLPLNAAKQQASTLVDELTSPLNECWWVCHLRKTIGSICCWEWQLSFQIKSRILENLANCEFDGFPEFKDFFGMKLVVILTNVSFSYV